MNFFSNSLFCSPNLGLVTFYLKQAVEKSSGKNLKHLDQAESEQLTLKFIYPAVEQCVKDVSNAGNWRDERDAVLLQIHGWLFMSWMITKFDSFDEMLVPIGTVFYVQVVKTCHFEKYLIQCLVKTDEEVMRILIQDFVTPCKAYDMKDDINFQLLEYCLLQLGNCQENVSDNMDGKLCHIITEIAKNIEQQWIQDETVTKLTEKLNTLLSQFKTYQRSNNIRNIFRKKTDILRFSERLSELISMVERPNVEIVLCAIEKTDFQELCNTILCLVTCINHVMRSKWFKCLIAKQFSGSNVNAVPRCYHVLFSLFRSCKLLQTLIIIESVTFNKQLQILIDMLAPYLKQHKTFEEISGINDMSNGQNVENENNDAWPEMINGTMEEKFQHALHEIKESLIHDETCYEWLLLQEELFTYEQWLKCVQIHSKKFISIKIMKLLLDVLYLLQGYDIGQGGMHKNIYNCLIKVILDGLCHLTISEQKEVVLYNFELSLVQFNTYEGSFFLHPDDETGEMEDFVIETLNKIVCTSRRGFPKDVMDDIIKSCLISPYLMMKKLFICAIHCRYQKVILELVQSIPWLLHLRCSKDIKSTEDVYSLIVKVIRFMLSYIVRVKQQTFSNFLTFIDVLMKPYIHPEFGTEEPALVTAHEISTDLVIPLLTKYNDVCTATNDQQVNFPVLRDKGDFFFLTLRDEHYNIILTDDEYDDLTVLVMHILLKCLSCELVSSDQQYSIDATYLFQLLFIVLDIYEDIRQIIQDLITNEGQQDTTDISFVWAYMDVSLKIVEEYLVPFLLEDMSREPTRYLVHISTIKNVLNKLDWIEQLLIIPLLQTVVLKEYRIKSPRSLLSLMGAQWNVESVQDVDSTSFWMMYFKSCAISKEVFEAFLLMLKEDHPLVNEIADKKSDEILHDVARVLPFTTRKQWQRVLNMGGEIIKCGYLMLPEGWKTAVVKFPDISLVYDHSVIKTSELLVLVLSEMSSMKWISAAIWSATLENYVFSMREQLETENNDKFEVIFHLLVHVTYITFKIVPNNCQSFLTGMVIEIFRQCLSTEEAKKNLEYLQDIIHMTTNDELKQIMKSTIAKHFQN